jgi:hypothetical protein
MSKEGVIYIIERLVVNQADQISLFLSGELPMYTEDDVDMMDKAVLTEAARQTSVDYRRYSFKDPKALTDARDTFARRAYTYLENRYPGK